jgi:hypothetical protein
LTPTSGHSNMALRLTAGYVMRIAGNPIRPFRLQVTGDVGPH